MVKQLLKKIIFLQVCLLLSVPIFAEGGNTPMEAFIAREQQQHNFIPVTDLWQMDNQFTIGQAETYVSRAQFFTLDFIALNNFMVSRNQGIRLSLPKEGGGTYDIDLARYDFLARGFKVQEVANNIATDFAYTPGLYYRGVVNGIHGSVAAFSFFNNEIYGVFSIPGVGNFTIVPNTLVVKSNNEHYILYNDADMKILPSASKCGTEDLDITQLHPGKAHMKNVFDNCKDVEVYILADYATYLAKSSNTTTVSNYITSIYNVLSTLYRNEGIYTSIKQISVNTATDDYQLLPSSSTDFLNKFGENTQNSMNGADLAHLVSTRYSGAMGGVAWLDELCESYFYYAPNDWHTGPYAFSNIYANETIASFPTYTWNVEVMTHEMGHSLGSPHTHNCTAWTGGPIDWCAPTYDPAYTEGACTTGPVPATGVGGTIMSYCHLLASVGINFSNGFGTQPGNLIRTNVSAASCAANYVPDTVLSVANTTLIANRECTDGAGITYYWYDNNDANEANDRLALKIAKNGNNIGDLDVVGFDVRTATSGTYGNNTGVAINLPVGTPNVQTNNAAMHRYWQVTATSSLTTNAEVYFPFTQQDITDVDGSVPGTPLTYSDLLFYKVTSAVDPNPANGLTGATTGNLNVYTYGTTPSLTQWAYATSGNTKFARFLVSSFSGGSGFGTSSNPLDLDIIYFKGVEKDRQIQLEWLVDQQKDIKEYIVEKSSDAVHYTSFVITTAKNQVKQVYNATDTDPRQGDNFYRLSYITRDGSRFTGAYTRVVINKTSSVNIYPNPASKELHVHVTGVFKENVQVRIMDMSGKLIFKSSYPDGNILVDISKLVKGIYAVQVVIAGEVVNERITVE